MVLLGNSVSIISVVLVWASHVVFENESTNKTHQAPNNDVGIKFKQLTHKSIYL